MLLQRPIGLIYLILKIRYCSPDIYTILSRIESSLPETTRVAGYAFTFIGGLFVMSNILQIAQLGNPVLREVAQPVELLADHTVQELIDDLIATMGVGNLGIAAPQVNHSLQVMIIACKPTQNYPDAPIREPFAVINPVLLSTHGDTFFEWEGCLSIPGFRGHVPRPFGITLQYLRRDGEEVTETVEGFLARVIQHEYDHLHGRVYLDRLESMLDLVTEQEFQRLRREDMTR